MAQIFHISETDKNEFYANLDCKRFSRRLIEGEFPNTDSDPANF